MDPRSGRLVGLQHVGWQVAFNHALAGWRRSIEDMVELIWFLSEQRWQMDDFGFVYMPYNLPHQRTSALVYVHGADAQTMNTFNRFVQ